LRRRRLTLTLLGVGCLATAATAQSRPLSNGTLRECYDAALPNDLRRVAGFISSDAADSAPAFVKPAELLLEIVGERVRASLGAKPGDLPIGEPMYTKDNVHGAIRVTLFRDGRMTAVVERDSLFANAPTDGLERVAKILRGAWDEGERVFWPEQEKGDSVKFRMGFWAAPPNRDGSPDTTHHRFAVAVFSIALPWIEHATVDDLPKPVYPDTPRSHNIQGTITMSFVVDTTGYALISTMHDVLPPGAPVPVGDMADYYREFVRAVAEAMPKGRFHAAMMAGCKFPQRVNLPFEFKLNTVR